jgi:prophage regulatory protein
MLLESNYACGVDLVSTVEIALMLNLSRQRVDKLSRTDAQFPHPVAALAIGRVWRRRDVEAWADTTGRQIEGVGA